jgi:hypothetical protein
MVDPCRAARSTRYEPDPPDFLLKINPKINYLEKFAKRPLSFFVIKPQSMKILRRPLLFKIFPKMPLATF